MINRIRFALLLSVALLLIALPSCGRLVNAVPTGTTPVAQLMPDLAGYRVVEGQTIQEYIATAAEGAALLSLNPQMALLIEEADQVVQCYQEIGAVSARIFSSESNPLSSGAIAIADRNRLADPSNFFRCVIPRAVPFSGGLGESKVEPCGTSYTLERDGNAFYILYVGTTEDICHTFCSRLEGCTAH
jgi:hypothetical protein